MQVSRIAMRCRALVWAALCWVCLGVAAQTLPAVAKADRVWALTEQMELIEFASDHPSQVLSRRPVTGLAAGDALVGMDFRVARGVLYALSRAGRLYTLATDSGALSLVGDAGPVLKGESFGVDFNPTVDRIRVVSHTGQNLRLHPDTAALVDGDPVQPGLHPDVDLHYAAGDPRAGRPPEVVAAGYTYHRRDATLTTNYAIDRAAGTLVRQGSLAEASPVQSPNLGELHTVGPLGLGPLVDASFDIADLSGLALLAARPVSQGQTSLYTVNLETGQATWLGPVGDGRPLRGLAIEP